MKITLKQNFVIGILTFLSISCTDDEFNLPYNSYSSILNQTESNNPTETILQNEINISINWTRESTGIFKGVLSKPLVLEKTTLVIYLQEEDRIPTGGFINPTTIMLNACNRFNVYDTVDGLTNSVIEIKEYR